MSARKPILLVLMTMLGLSNAGLLLNASCPDIPVKRNFDIDRYLGRWFAYEQFFSPYQAGLKCDTAEYSAGPAQTIIVQNTAINATTNKMVEEIGNGTVPDQSEPAKLEVIFDGAPFAGNYWVVSTDYTCFAVVYSCNQVGPNYIETAYILTRRRGRLSRKVKNRIYRKLRRNGIDTSSFLTVDQTGCPRCNP